MMTPEEIAKCIKVGDRVYCNWKFKMLVHIPSGWLTIKKLAFCKFGRWIDAACCRKCDGEFESEEYPDIILCPGLATPPFFIFEKIKLRETRDLDDFIDELSL